MNHQITEREALAAFLLRQRARGVVDQRLLGAFESVPRRAFVDGLWANAAYGSRTLPIDCGEFIEGLDLQAEVIATLGLEGAHRVLEVGTGSGYTAAVMSRLAARVHSVDRYQTLIDQAKQRYEMLKIENVFLKKADGRHGLAGEGPFDRVVVWASFESMPRQFVDMVASGGSMIVAIGPADGTQIFTRLTKVGSRFEREDFASVRLSPLMDGMAEAL
ncbi:MAG: protein-L-isoaspartate(D-aspartate) O-methyltransferase [Phyllobacterium sp.]